MKITKINESGITLESDDGEEMNICTQNSGFEFQYQGKLYEAKQGTISSLESEQVHNMAACMLSILDSLKLYDQNQLVLDNETLSEMMFRKMKGYNIDLNKELGFTHLKPIKKDQ